jgi:hypothetical protein
MTQGETEKKFELKFRFVVGLICGTLFIVLVIWTTYRAKEKDTEYPTLTSDNKARGTVISVKKERSWIRLRLNDNTKWTIRTPEDLIEFIRRDDIFVKEQESDTIYVTRDNLIYKFCIRDN